MADLPSSPAAPRNIWKIAALVSLLLIAAVFASRAMLLRDHRVATTEDQSRAALAAATAALQPQLPGLGPYNATVGRYVFTMDTPFGPKTAVPVFFTAGNTTLTALVDLSTGEVVQTVEVHSTGWMSDFKGSRRGFFPGPPRGFPPGSSVHR
ncbi:MAG: hypothetical protein HY558_03290 [Euryarchaeota archaeon]|nr:hypothetical protein [Euryarchaeota archaeon]